LAECRRGRFVSFDDSISVLLQQGVEEMIYERGQVPDTSRAFATCCV